MRDRFFLLAAAAAFAVSAWAFWHFLGDKGFSAVTLMALIGVVADNYRLRRKLRERTKL